MDWLFWGGVIGLVLSGLLSVWDDWSEVFGLEGRKRAKIIKGVLGLLCLVVAVVGFWQSDKASERGRKALTDKVEAGNALVLSLRADLTVAQESAASNALQATFFRSANVDAQLKAAKDKERFISLQEFSTRKFTLAHARESLTNTLERIRLEEERKRLDAELAEPALKAAAEKARQDQEVAQSKIKEANLDRFSPYIDDTLTSLLIMLRDANEAATQSTLNWTCRDVRKLIESNGRCEIKMGEQSPWVYTIDVSGFHPAPRAIRLQITCTDRAPDSGTSVNSGRSFTNELDLSLPIGFFPKGPATALGITFRMMGQNIYVNRVPFSDYTNAVRTSLGHLIAAQPDIPRK